MAQALSALAAVLLQAGALYAQDAGSRAAFTRGGWLGARYVAMGKAAEAVVDDVYAIYWNPAGLCGLREKVGLSTEEVRTKVEKGDISKITEDDLIRFSGERGTGRFVQIGLSGGMLDINRQSAFAGAAFGLFNGVMGCGAYTIMSTGIEGRDEAGNYTEKLNYAGTEAMLSYAFIVGIASVGITVKGLSEVIGKSDYYGWGIDAGTLVDILPFMTVGLMVRDIGTSIYAGRSGGFREKLDIGYPSLNVCAAVSDRSRYFTFSVTGVKKIDQKDVRLNAGVRYSLTKAIDASIGIAGGSFSGGLAVTFWKMEIAYAFIFDRIDFGINNIVSLIMAF